MKVVILLHILAKNSDQNRFFVSFLAKIPFYHTQEITNFLIFLRVGVIITSQKANTGRVGTLLVSIFIGDSKLTIGTKINIIMVVHFKNLRVVAP